MFRGQHPAVTGFFIADAEDTVAKKDRGSAMPRMVTLGKEKRAGYGDWQNLRPGDPANFMWWPLDPNVPPSRGAITGSYSMAIPARQVPEGSSDYLPLAVPGSVNKDYKKETIKEADPLDWIILATTEHGGREKLAFRSGANPLLIADHRSLIAPQLSSIVHDGRGLSHDTVRKAGLHTCWEVRHWVEPVAGLPKTGVFPSSPTRYSIAWVADQSPDNTGFARIGFGSEDGLYSHMVSGPFIPSLRQKHLLSTTPDGPIISGALSTNSYFRGSQMPFTAPLDFEEKFYPNPADSTYEYKVFLWYDKKRTHPFFDGPREGLWRWFTRIPLGTTPTCSPTKDYSTVALNGNPRRTFAENARGIMHQKLISPGLYMSPRANLLRGRIPGVSVKHV